MDIGFRPPDVGPRRGPPSKPKRCDQNSGGSRPLTRPRRDQSSLDATRGRPPWGTTRSSIPSTLSSSILCGIISSMSAKVRENRLRRAAARQGLGLVKSRRRDERAIDFGSYMLFDLHRKVTVLGGASPWTETLDDIEAYLMRPAATARERVRKTKGRR